MTLVQYGMAVTLTAIFKSGIMISLGRLCSLMVSNHENHVLLDSYPISEWNGGKVHFIAPSIIHLMRGQVYNIDGYIFFTMGGAQSHDKEYRKEGISWWPREMPSDEEYQEALNNLAKAHHCVDYVITHCAPDHIQNQFGYYMEHDKLTNFLKVVSLTTTFKGWFLDITT